MAYKNKEDRNAYYRKWYANNPDKRDLARRKWEAKVNYPELRATKNEARKLRVLAHYGKGGRVHCFARGCSVTDPDMLTLDHVNNDGAEDRRKQRTANTYVTIERRGYPEGFQTLCCNHQWKKEVLRRRSLRNA